MVGGDAREVETRHVNLARRQMLADQDVVQPRHGQAREPRIARSMLAQLQLAVLQAARQLAICGRTRAAVEVTADDQRYGRVPVPQPAVAPQRPRLQQPLVWPEPEVRIQDLDAYPVHLEL